ncbi:MAG: ribosome hibernation-promoting factor, HPF/YfiA family [Christensenellales bacterium]|jgi:putative sigma-54 modulation protein
MRIIISSKNMTLSEDLRNLFMKKAGKLERYLRMETDVLATFSQEGSREIIEVTIPLNGAVLRAQESGYDFYTAVDVVLERLERQMRKHRTRLARRLREDAFESEQPVFMAEFDDEQEADDGPRIVRTKRFSVKPMDTEEAVAQMEMLGHTFFVYLDAETERVSVVYKRHDGNYGLIEADIG